MDEDLRDICGPVLGTLSLLLDEIRLLVEDGGFGLVKEAEEVTHVDLVDGTGTPATHLGGQP